MLDGHVKAPVLAEEIRDETRAGRLNDQSPATREAGIRVRERRHGIGNVLNDVPHRDQIVFASGVLQARHGGIEAFAASDADELFGNVDAGRRRAPVRHVLQKLSDGTSHVEHATAAQGRGVEAQIPEGQVLLTLECGPVRLRKVRRVLRLLRTQVVAVAGIRAGAVGIRPLPRDAAPRAAHVRVGALRAHARVFGGPADPAARLQPGFFM